MPSLAQQLCLNHPSREAVARCPQCQHFFCRECVTEHDDRLLCASCLRKLSKTEGPRRRPLRILGRAGWSAAGLMTAVIFFYWMGQLLLLIPASFHDGTLWKENGWWHP